MEPATVHPLRPALHVPETAGRAPARPLPAVATPSLLAQSLTAPDTSIRPVIEQFTNRPLQIAPAVDGQRRARTSAGMGKRCSVREDIVGGRLIRKKKTT